MKSKRNYNKPNLSYRAFVTEKTMANAGIVSAANYGQFPRNVKYIVSDLREM